MVSAGCTLCRTWIEYVSMPWGAALLAYMYSALYTRTHVDSSGAPRSELTCFAPFFDLDRSSNFHPFSF